MTTEHELAHARSVAATAAFDELIRRRGRFVRITLALCCAWFSGVVILIAFAHELLRRQIVPGLSLAYLLGLSIFLMVWAASFLYLRRSARVFMPLERRALAEAAGAS